MPTHARGAFYYGKTGIAEWMKCQTNHSRITDEMYNDMTTRQETGMRQACCRGCRALFYISYYGEERWEIREFPFKPQQETEQRGLSKEKV